MNYFILSNSTGKDIGKKYPQTDGMGGLYPFGDKDSISNLTSFQIPDFTPNLNYFNIHKSAKLTDFVSTGLITAKGFLVSKKAKITLEQFNLPKHKFYPAKLLYKDKFYEDYYWMHLGEDFTDYIEFDKTEFITKNQPPWDVENWDYKITTIDIPNIDTLLSIKSKYAGSFTIIEPRSLFFNSKFNKEIDLIAISAIQDGIVLISEKLREALTNQNIDGIQVYKPAYPIY
jgi:hypothetical protein